jgi:hypothetical protein
VLVFVGVRKGYNKCSVCVCVNVYFGEDVVALQKCYLVDLVSCVNELNDTD